MYLNESEIMQKDSRLLALVTTFLESECVMNASHKQTTDVDKNSGNSSNHHFVSLCQSSVLESMLVIY